MKDLAAVYRLGRARTTTDEEADDELPVIDRAAMVEEKLSQIEARLKEATG